MKFVLPVRAGLLSCLTVVLLTHEGKLDAGNTPTREASQEEQIKKAVKRFVGTPCIQQLLSDAQQSERFWDQQFAQQTIQRWIDLLQQNIRPQEEKKS